MSSEYPIHSGANLSRRVVLKTEKTLGADDLLAHCRRSLANYKIPRRVKFSEIELPKSGSGKILERILREHFWGNQQRAVAWRI